MPVEPAKERVGISGFPALLVDASLINRSDLALAEQHAVREEMPLADAVVALGLVRARRFADRSSKGSAAPGSVDLGLRVDHELERRLLARGRRRAVGERAA